MAATNRVREDLSQKFLEALNQGYIPWAVCWHQRRPENAVTGQRYRGVNAVSLSYAADDRGYTDPRWCTYRQAQEKGWQVRKGEKGAHVEYWAYYDLTEKKLLSWQDVKQKLKADPDYEKHLQLRCRVYSVFNAQQIDGIPEPEQRPSTNIGAFREKRDTLIRNMGIGYEEHGVQAYYSPGMDAVTLPPEATFDDAYSYMATFLHECGHASGHPDRLNRDLSGIFGSKSYAREELRAEIASAFTVQSIGLQLTDAQLAYHTRHHAGYVQHWAAILKDAPDELFRAIKAAEEISDYLILKGEFEMIQEAPEPDLKEWCIVYNSSDSLDGTLVIVPANEVDDRDVLETYRCASAQEAAEKLQRYEQLQSNFWEETNDPETQEWRDELTADEAAMVAKWDEQTAQGMENLVADIRVHEAAMAPAPETMIVAIESTDDYTDAHFHAELVDLDKQNPDGSWGTVEEKYRLVKIGVSGHIEALDEDLIFQTEAQARSAAETIPYARLVDYDTLVHEAGENLTAKEENMTVVMVEPGKEARIEQIPHKLEAMQQAVGGSIEATYPFEDPVAIVCNDNEKWEGLPLNRGLYAEHSDLYDIISGTFFVTGIGKEGFCSLSPELAQKYQEHFKSPEHFFNLGGKTVGFKTTPEDLPAAVHDYLVKNAQPVPAQPAPTLKLSMGE